MRVALVHDWLTGMRGGERLLHEIVKLFPDAALYTLVHVPGSTSAAIDALAVRASALSRLPGIARHYRKLLPLFPHAIERLRIEPCDLVISTSHAFAKGVRAPAGVPHLCYCMTPMRYVWDQADAYLGRGLRRAASLPLAAYLRRWDQRTATPERVTRFVAISRTVAERIRRHYGREASILYPPVDVERISCADAPPEDFYLLVGGFVPYKREALAIEAFRRLDRALVVGGDGPDRRRIERSAPDNVRFVGRIGDASLADHYRRCRALIYPQEEDFGIVAVEAQAAGRPVIAFGSGGAAETVVPLHAPGSAAPTGVWFDEATPDALVAAVRTFERSAERFDAKAIRAHSETFGAKRFARQLQQVVREVLGERG